MLRVPKITSNYVYNDQYWYASNTEKCLFNTSKPPSVVGSKERGKSVEYDLNLEFDSLLDLDNKWILFLLGYCCLKLSNFIRSLV